MPAINKLKNLTTKMPIYIVHTQYSIFLSCDNLFDAFVFLQIKVLAVYKTEINGQMSDYFYSFGPICKLDKRPEL